jgi:hypothetical protein
MAVAAIVRMNKSHTNNSNNNKMAAAAIVRKYKSTKKLAYPQLWPMTDRPSDAAASLGLDKKWSAGWCGASCRALRPELTYGMTSTAYQATDGSTRKTKTLSSSFLPSGLHPPNSTRFKPTQVFRTSIPRPSGTTLRLPSLQQKGKANESKPEMGVSWG